MSQPARDTLRATVDRFVRRLHAWMFRPGTETTASPAPPESPPAAAETVVQHEPVTLTLTLHPIAQILHDAAGTPGTIERLVTYPQETVSLSPLRSGANALASVPARESEAHVSWAETAYRSAPPAAYGIPNALVHGSAGLVGIGETLVTETTWHTHPDRHRYRCEDGAIRITADAIPALAGTYLSLLTPGGHSYWHAVIDGVAKVSVLPEALLATVGTILYASDAIGQKAFLDLYGLPPTIALRAVEPWETFRVETLILPWDLHGVFNYHPVINRFFDTVLTHHVRDRGLRIERLYIDRRGSSLRRLSNEDAVVAALEPLGFVAIRLEDLSIERQVALFRQAAIIVSPHGAGLTNIGFAPPGCIVIELMMDAYLNWCFRRIAALRGLHYDCVIGTARRPWATLDVGFHAQVWEIDVADVLEATKQALGEPPR